MIVLGSQSYLFESTNQYCNVTPYDRSQTRRIEIRDGALAYDCPHSGETYILILRNALHVPEMKNNLLPPFILREGGVTVNDKAKIHCKEPTVEDHTVSFESLELDLRIHLQLNGIFSCFHTRCPNSRELDECDKIFMTPDSSQWNPNCTSFANNESSILDSEGNIAVPRRWLREPMLFEKETSDEDLFDIGAFTATDCDAAIDANISSAIVAEDCLCQDTTNLDQDFAFALNAKQEINSLAATLSSATCDLNDDISTELFDTPQVGSLDALRDLLKEYVPEEKLADIEAIVSATAASATGPSSSQLSKLWMISEPLAQAALDQNSNLARIPADNSLSRNFSTNDRMLRYRRLSSIFFTDALVAKNCPSTRKNKYAQIFVSDKGYVAVYPMKTQSQFEEALHWFCKQVGVPRDLVMDGHKSMSHNQKVRRFSHQVGLTMKVLERNTPWANRAELYIGLLKKAVLKDLRASDAPMVLWDYALQRRAMIHNLIPRPLFQNDRSPHEATFGEQGSISRVCNFGFMEFVYYRDHGSFPEGREKLGRVLGPTINEGNEMAQNVLTSKGTVVSRRTMRTLTVAERHADVEKHKQQIFNKLTREKLGTSLHNADQFTGKAFDPYSDDDESESVKLPVDNDPVNDEGVALFEKPITDKMINLELSLPQGEELHRAKVIGRKRNSDGEVIGTYSDNPYTNTMMYEVEFDDGSVREYAANVIAENLYAQIDADGYSHTMLDCILDYRKLDDAVEQKDMYITSGNGQRRLRNTTCGWEFLVKWKDDSKQWLPLRLLKESNPCEVADFAISRSIDKEAAFRWWIPYTLRRRSRIISAVNSRVKRVSHKYGLELPTSVKHAHAIDEKNKNTYWRDAINKEMGNLIVAFDILEDDEKLPQGFAKASGHLVFDIRMTLERKARWVKDGHRTPDPIWSTYAGVVSRESVRIALTYAALNDLDVCGADIQNAYLQAPSSEKHYVICGAEFGIENIGKRAIIRRALYGGKSAGADYWRHVRQAMAEMDFKTCKADPDVWMRPGLKKDGTAYWQYVLLYTDDILAIMEDAESFLRDEFSKFFTLKQTSIGPPTQYLGNKVSQVDLEGGVTCWAFSSSQYVQAACSNVDEYLTKNKERILTKSRSPWPSNYRPESDVSPELSPEKASYFQSLVGVLRWIVELGRADLCMEVSALASMMALPREGHLKAILQMFSFLKNKHNGVMAFDPTPPEIDESKFVKEDWSASEYGECEETLPHEPPETRGLGFIMRAFVDSDHAGDSITRRSRTGFIIFLNSAPIYWYSKKQTSVETSSFGAEFIAMKSCCEYVRGLRFKLRMMGIPVELPTYVFGDNQSVLKNTSSPHSTLKKKSSSVAFHFVREGVVKDEWRTTYLNTHLNPADMLTKCLPGGEKRSLFTSYLLHYVD